MMLVIPQVFFMIFLAVEVWTDSSRFGWHIKFLYMDLFDCQFPSN